MDKLDLKEKKQHSDKKMVQLYEKSASEMDDRVNKKELTKKSGEKQADTLLGDLNPRYFKEALTLKKAKQRDWAKYGNKYQFKI